MGTTLRCIDVIYKTITILSIRVIVLHGNLYDYTVLLSFAVNDFRVKRFLFCFCSDSLQIHGYHLHNGKLSLFPFLLWYLCKRNLQSLCKKCHLTKTLFQNIIIIYCFLEYLFIRKEDNCCSGLILGCSLQPSEDT